MHDLANPNRRLVGMKQVSRALEGEQAEKVFLALDADDHILRRFRALCRERNVEYDEVDTMAELGAACRIDIGAAVACLLKAE
ncbi:MAG: ribosomal L7Ae/L30e/S12e/Gadd45 family protein [Eubacteriales bacterium]|nr:ribosomal L7Ae/L30e/S12e/Gadd45 family protein [Eubacteriales bacterium]